MRSLSALLLFAALPAQVLACTYDRGDVQEANLYYELGSSSLGMSSRFMNMNSVRSNPIPAAPA